MPEAKQPFKIFLSAGEISGDFIGGRLALAIAEANPACRLTGFGGTHMRRSGVRVARDTVGLGVIGITEAAAQLPALIRTLAEARALIRREAPDAAVLIGCEGFHLPLGRWLRSRGVFTVCLFPPQVWIWQRFAGPIARSFDAIISSFPLEDRVYSQTGTRCYFAGHYLKDLIGNGPANGEGRLAARKKLGLCGESLLLALLPGSRQREVRLFTPLLLETARILLRRDRRVVFALPVSHPDFLPVIDREIRSRELSDRVRILPEGMAALGAADLAIVASGTATLEAALLEVPMIIFYRIAPLSFRVVRLLQKAGFFDHDRIGLPNLICGPDIVPELHQRDATPQRLAGAAWALLQDPAERLRMKHDLREVRRQLGSPGSLDRAAAYILAEARKAGSFKPHHSARK